jgi:acetyltransferase-like isoleucine patch superfamily enzyme
MSGSSGGNIRSLLGMRPDMGFGFYLRDFIFRRILRQNAGVRWAVHHTATIYSPEKITKGKGVFPGDSPGVYINAMNGFSIGDHSNIGPNVGILTVNHDFVDNAKFTASPPVIIGRFCWLGMNVSVLPGVQLGDFTIVGAGAVVTKSFTEGYCVLGGNPAKILKYLNKEECDAFARSKE